MSTNLGEKTVKQAAKTEHIGPQDFIPQEELAKLLAKSGSETAKAQAAALEEAQKIQADNVGHRMLQAMGWREGQGLGASASGIAAPIAAAAAKQPIDKGGLGARVCPLAIPLSVPMKASDRGRSTLLLSLAVPRKCCGKGGSGMRVIYHLDVC